MNENIRIPDILTDSEAIRQYVSYMRGFYERQDEFYSGSGPHPIGKFCEGGAKSAALQIALGIQNPIKVTECKSIEEMFV